VSLASGGILFYYLIPTLISIYTQRLTEMLPLKAPSLFASVRVIAGSIEWSNGLDLSYDTLYLGGLALNSTATSQELQKTA